MERFLRIELKAFSQVYEKSGSSPMRNLSPELYTSGKYTFPSNKPVQCQDTFNITESASLLRRSLDCKPQDLIASEPQSSPVSLGRPRFCYVTGARIMKGQCVQATQSTSEFIQHVSR
jgi:hypothetical protein